MEGRASCGLSAKLGKRRAAASFPGLAGTDFRGRRPGASPLGCSSSLFYLQAETLAESTHGPREGGRKKGHPLGDACRVGPAPPALYSGGWGGPPRRRLSPEKQFGVTSREDHKIFQDTFAAHTSLKHSTEVPKVKPGGREEGLRMANGATVGCAQCWSGGSYLLLRVRLEWGPPASPRDVWGPPGSGAGRGGAKEAGSVLLVGCLGTMGAWGRGRAGE